MKNTINMDTRPGGGVHLWIGRFVFVVDANGDSVVDEEGKKVTEYISESIHLDKNETRELIKELNRRIAKEEK